MIGIDLGGTNIRAAIVSPAAGIVCSRRIATRIDLGVASLVDRLERLCRTLIGDAGMECAAVGLGIPGILNLDGSVRVSPNLPELNGIPLARLLQERIGCPVFPVNDADAIAWGEALAGAGRRLNTLLAVTLGTGIGGGLVLDRTLWAGLRPGASGEIGHLTVEPDGRLCGCGNRGCLETYSSATGIVRSVRESLADDRVESTLRRFAEGELTAQEIAKAARSGDVVARAAFDLAARKLGQALAGTINLLNPDALIFCGGLSNSFPLMEKTIEHELLQRSFVYHWSKPLLLRGELGDDAGILGAADLAARNLGFTLPPAGRHHALRPAAGKVARSRKLHMTTSQEELEARELYRLIIYDSPEAILDEVSELLHERLAESDLKLVRQCYATAVQLYRGEWPGYQACNTEYHNLFHASHTFLTLARYIHGSYLEDETFTSRAAALALCTAVFHDAGYLQTTDDSGSGAKYTREHIRRGIDLFATLAPEWGIAADELVEVERFFTATDLAVPYDAIPFADDEYRRLALFLDAADLITQMSDRAYLEKLLFLYHEFREAGLTAYDNETEMLRKTIDFYEMIGQRLRGIEVEADSRIRAHFLFRNGIAVNPYQESIRRQKKYLAEILELPDAEPIAHLKRDGIVDKVRKLYHTNA